jgi:RNA methyltransferase, TrmH family
VFEKMAYRDRPDGLLMVMPQIRRTLADLVVPDRGLFLIAEAIEKPGNLGTMLRTADATGVQGVIVCDRCTDLNNPNVVRASTGTIFSVPVVEATSEETIRWLEQNQVTAVAATPHTDKMYTDVSYKDDRVAFIMGTEQYGLSDQWMKRIDQKVRIPMMGQADSLNVSAATTILLYEALRQRSV